MEHVSVQRWGERMLTKSEELVPNGLGSKLGLKGILLFSSGKLRQELSCDVRPAYNREQLKITDVLREQGFQPFFHGEPKLPGVRKGDTFVQLMFAAITNNSNHFSNLIHVFSP